MPWSPERTDLRRLNIAVSVRIVGTDSSGQAFECEAWTLNVSPKGAAMQVPEHVDLPKTFRVVADDYQFHADAEVTLMWERARPQRAVGVRIAAGTPRSSWHAR